MSGSQKLSQCILVNMSVICSGKLSYIIYLNLTYNNFFNDIQQKAVEKKTRTQKRDAFL